MPMLATSPRALLALALAAAVSPAFAGGENAIVVTTTGDSMDAFDQLCSLREALHNANTNTRFSPVENECAPGSSDVTDAIELAAGATYTLTITGGGDDEGDLDVLDGSSQIDGSPDTRLRVAGEGGATIEQTVAGQRVMEVGFETGLTLQDLTLRGGDAGAAGGGGIRNGGQLVLTRVTLVANDALAGGGLYNTVRTDLIDSQVLLNDGGFNGGGIMNFSGTVTLSGTVVRGNEAVNGGGIFDAGAASTQIAAGSAVNLNSATAQGGGLHHAGTGALDIASTRFESNTAGAEGGAIYYAAPDDLQLAGIDFIGNRASHGGAIGVFQTSDVRVSGGLFEDNEATTNGGAIRAANAIIEGATFRLNMAGARGGAVEALNSAAIIASRFEENQGVDGGAIYAQQLTLQDSDLTENLASSRGGGVYVYNNSSITGTRIVGNLAATGGGLFVDDSAFGGLDIRRTLLASNGAVGQGGGIHTEGDVELTNSTLSANYANDDGANLYVAATGAVTARYATIVNGGIAENIENHGSLTLGRSLIGTPAQTDCVVPVVIVSLGGNRADDASCTGLVALTDQTNVNLMIGPLTDNGGNTRTHALMPGSPAINGGTLACDGEPVDGVDQRGALRPAGGACDSGAFELDGELDESVFRDGFED